MNNIDRNMTVLITIWRKSQNNQSIIQNIFLKLIKQQTQRKSMYFLHYNYMFVEFAFLETLLMFSTF